MDVRQGTRKFNCLQDDSSAAAEPLCVSKQIKMDVRQGTRTSTVFKMTGVPRKSHALAHILSNERASFAKCRDAAALPNANLRRPLRPADFSLKVICLEDRADCNLVMP